MPCIKKCRDDFMYNIMIILFTFIFLFPIYNVKNRKENDPYHCKYLKIGNYVIQQLRDSYKLAGRHKGVSKN